MFPFTVDVVTPNGVAKRRSRRVTRRLLLCPCRRRDTRRSPLEPLVGRSLTPLQVRLTQLLTEHRGINDLPHLGDFAASDMREHGLIHLEGSSLRR